MTENQIDRSRKVLWQSFYDLRSDGNIQHVLAGRPRSISTEADLLLSQSKRSAEVDGREERDGCAHVRKVGLKEGSER